MTVDIRTFDKIRQWPDPTTGYVRWFATSTQLNFNDTNIAINRQAFAELYNRGPTVITHLDIGWKAATSGAGVYMMVMGSVRALSRIDQPIGYLVSTALSAVVGAWAMDMYATDCYIYIPSDPENAEWSSVPIWIQFYGGAGYANDDFGIGISGYCIPSGVSPQVVPSPTPVSLEGYRWPLRKVT